MAQTATQSITMCLLLFRLHMHSYPCVYDSVLRTYLGRYFVGTSPYLSHMHSGWHRKTCRASGDDPLIMCVQAQRRRRVGCCVVRLAAFLHVAACRETRTSGTTTWDEPGAVCA